eukprot:UN11894
MGHNETLAFCGPRHTPNPCTLSHQPPKSLFGRRFVPSNIFSIWRYDHDSKYENIKVNSGRSEIYD